MSELKPCPFCGGEAEIRTQDRPDGNTHYYVYIVRCKECRARTEDFPIAYYVHHDVEDAIEAWNRRAEAWG